MLCVPTLLGWKRMGRVAVLGLRARLKQYDMLFCDEVGDFCVIYKI
jgi:hypothetical protein